MTAFLILIIYKTKILTIKTLTLKNIYIIHLPNQHSYAFLLFFFVLS